ncbi:MAG: CoA-binding protein [Desulfurococcales archaeon]|nr:CoA-binding protein [Desulfurococcales archaeon]
MRDLDKVKALFEAESVAVVGASRNPDKTGHAILKNILESGFRGRLYPVNPKAGEILGLKAYASLKDIPEPVDLAVIVVPARFVPSVIEEAGEKGVKAAVIISGGFRETGKEEGKRLESELVEKAKKYGLRFLGPNCQGVNNPHKGLCASWPKITRKGPLAIISQSGTIAAAFEIWAEEEGIGISKMAALGNKADIDETDLLQYFGEDPNTKAVGMYIEAVRDGKRFINVVSEVTTKKPVVILKSGRTVSGAKAVASHTGSLAGSYALYLAAFRKAGAIPVDGIEELYDVTKGLAFLPKPKGPRVQIVTSSGGSGIISTDNVEELGLKMASLSEDIKYSLKDELPDYCIIKNPLDLTGDADAERYDIALKHVFRDDSVDIVIVIFGDPIPGASEVMRKWFGKGKVLVPVYLGGGDVEKVERRKMNEAGIPAYPTPERAVKVVRALWDYTTYLKVKEITS